MSLFDINLLDICFDEITLAVLIGYTIVWCAAVYAIRCALLRYASRDAVAQFDRDLKQDLGVQFVTYYLIVLLLEVVIRIVYITSF